MNLIKSSSPHIHSGITTRTVMRDVVIALLPAAIASIVLYGLKAALLIAVCVVCAVLSEYLFNVITKHQQTAFDFAAVVTGLLLALNLSTNVELWQAAVGSIFAIVVVKCMFGGLGKNITNPAITARVFMLIAFGTVAGGANPAAADLVSSATPLEQLAATGSAEPTLIQMLLGLRGGTIGEGCIVALLVGYAYLVYRKHIKWYVPAAFIVVVFVLYFAFTFNFSLAIYEILAGGLFLGAIFMATDYVTTPITNKGKVVFAIGCGIITFIIRYFCAYPEGVSFSILCMNLLVPYIEKWTAHTPLGGKPHQLPFNFGGKKNA